MVAKKKTVKKKTAKKKVAKNTPLRRAVGWKEVTFNEFLEKNGNFFRNFVYFTIHLFLIILMLGLGKLTLLQSITSISNTLIYIIIGIWALIVGLLAASIFNHINKTHTYIVYGVVYSSFLSIIFAFNSLINKSIVTLLETKQFLVDVKSSGCGDFGTLVDTMNPELFNVTFGFFIALIALNIPFIIYYNTKKEKNWVITLTYLIPIIIFFLISYAYTGMSDVIIGMFY